MNKNYFIIGLAAVSMGIFAFQNDTQMKVESGVASALKHKQNGGGQSGLTGAPGEGNCTQCHIGSVLDGSSENVFSLLNAQLQPVTSYNPGDTYTVGLQLSSDPAKKGFSATALDPSNSMAGSFTGDGSVGGTQDFSSGGRDYVSHTLTSNTDSTPLWAWTWTAPSTNVGDVTFYVASNVANGNNQQTGDMIYLSQHVFGSVASVSEEKSLEHSFNAGYNPTTNSVVVDFTSLTADAMSFNLVDMSGKSVYSKSMSDALVGSNKHTIPLPSSVENGMYVVNFFVGNNPMSTKILVQK